MDQLSEIHENIKLQITLAMNENELEIQRWGNQFPGDMGFRRQVEIAHKTVGLVTALNIVDAVMLQYGSTPPAGV